MRSQLLLYTLILCGVSFVTACSDEAGPTADSSAQAEADQSAPVVMGGLPESDDSEMTSPTEVAAPAAQVVSDATAQDSPDAAADAAPDATPVATADAAADVAPTEALPGHAVPEDCTFITTESGLSYVVIVKGDEGEGCKLTDTVTVHYTGYLLDGTRFDGSQPGRPATFPVAGVIDGWKEALALMTPGTKLKIVIPADLAYGEGGYRGLIPPNSDLVFDMQLASVKAPPTPTAVPTFEQPGEDEMTTTESGLQQKIVIAGTGASPAVTDTVTVHYAGWLTDGTLFDNSYERGEPTSFPLNRVIGGWTEGLQLMREGGTSIFVIPSELGYGEGGKGRTIPPNAVLIFRVDLISVDG